MGIPRDTILSKLQYFAETTPDKICLIDAVSGEKATYADFWAGILKYAAVTQQDRYYILQTRQTITHLVAFYGIQAAGSVAIPVEATATKERLSELAAQFGAEVLPVEYTLGDSQLPFAPPDPERIACVICTTGTTGKSKGVLSSFRCRFCGADNVRFSYDITPEDTALIPQVLSHSGGLRRVEAMLVSGATAVIMGAAMLFGNVFEAVRKYHCTILQFVPAQVAQILQRAEKLLLEVAPQLRIVSVGSAVIPEQDKERLRELLPGVRLFNDFGSTEAVGSAYFEWSAYPPKPNCVGTASLHSKIVFLDDNGAAMEQSDRDHPGVIATEGGTLMSGYLNAPDLTAEMMRDGRVLSADLGYQGEDGMIYILGRRDDMIVSGANKISPSEIEDAVLTISGVKECACVPRPDRIMGQMPALFIVWKKDAMAYDELTTELRKKLDAFKIPRAADIHEIDVLPRTPGTGKIIKRELIHLLKMDERCSDKAALTDKLHLKDEDTHPPK